MMSWIWGGLMIFSVVTAVFSNRMAALSSSVLESAHGAVELCISIAGIIVFWSGLMKIAEKSGLMRDFGRLMRPLLRFLFPDVPAKSEAFNAMAMNMGANILGLGNAATPFGLRAMEELQRLNPERERASRSMILFVVLNTASLQLMPTMLIGIRAAAGSQNPGEILPAVWLASIGAVTAGIITAKLVGVFWR